MPLDTIESNQNQQAWGIWRITEDEDSLSMGVNEFESIPENITHPQKRLEFVAGRLLAKILIEKLGKSFSGITKDQFGKPFYKNHSVQLSLSHSYPYVAAIADSNKSVGIDVEQPKLKLLKIASRVLHSGELADAGENVTKHCVYWCAKEAMIKIYGKKDLILAEQLMIEPFHLQTEGEILGTIVANQTETKLPLFYKVFSDFVIVFNT